MQKRILTRTRIERAGLALTSAIGVVVGIQAVLAQGGSVTVEVGECVNLQSPEERFACYERQVGAARTAPPAAPALAPPPAPTAAPALAPPPAPTTAPTPSPAAAPSAAPQAEAAEPQEFVATVQSLRQTVPNSYVITLDNGQVWRQTYAEWYPLRPGQKVRVRPSRWGGTFWLTADEANGFIQVKRVR